MQTRANWIDYGKGIGIVVMVYTHLLSSAYHAGIRVPADFFAFSDSLSHGFLMATFLFFSGLFVESSFRKRGIKTYVVDKFLRIYYPYLVWSIIQVSVEIAFSSRTQQGATLPDLFAIIYRPWGQFWFLYALLEMNLAYAVFSYFGKYTIPLMFIISTILFFNPIFISEFAMFGFGIHFLFFVTGIVFGRLPALTKKIEVPLWGALLPLATLLGSGYIIFEKMIAPMRLEGTPYPLYFLFLSILGIITFFFLSHYLAAKNIAPFLQTLGNYSIQIFLVHMLAGVGLRETLLFIGIQNWGIHIVTGVTFAVAVPVVIQKISERLDFPYLFELKRRKPHIEHAPANENAEN